VRETPKKRETGTKNWPSEGEEKKVDSDPTNGKERRKLNNRRGDFD
jgi:hypothetical protein